MIHGIFPAAGSRARCLSPAKLFPSHLRAVRPGGNCAQFSYVTWSQIPRGAALGFRNITPNYVNLDLRRENKDRKENASGARPAMIIRERLHSHFDFCEVNRYDDWNIYFSIEIWCLHRYPELTRNTHRSIIAIAKYFLFFRARFLTRIVQALEFTLHTHAGNRNAAIRWRVRRITTDPFNGLAFYIVRQGSGGPSYSLHSYFLRSKQGHRSRSIKTCQSNPM